MKQSVQFIVNEQGLPEYAVLSYERYKQLIEGSTNEAKPVASALLCDDQRFIALPYGGSGAQLDVARLADLMQRSGKTQIAINQRAQALDKFPEDQRATLDPLIRRVFLAKDSPYKNTMQATQEVIDALVETGIFHRTQAKFGYSARVVKALEVNQGALHAYLQEHGPVTDPIDVAELD